MSTHVLSDRFWSGRHCRPSLYELFPIAELCSRGLLEHPFAVAINNFRKCVEDGLNEGPRPPWHCYVKRLQPMVGSFSIVLSLTTGLYIRISDAYCCGRSRRRCPK